MTKKSRDLQLKGELYDVFADDLIAIRDNAYDIVSQLSRLSSLDTQKVLELEHRLVGGIGEGSYMVPPFRCDYGINIYLGKNSFVDYNCCFLDAGTIDIGDNVYIGPNCCIFTPCHPVHYKLRWDNITEYAAPVKIESDVYIAAETVIAPGVKIGQGSVIGAGSVVTKDVPPHSFAQGNPCRVIRQITEQDKQAFADKILNDKEKDSIYKQEHGYVYEAMDGEIRKKIVDATHNVDRLNKISNSNIQLRRDFIRTFMPAFGEGAVLMSPFRLQRIDHLKIGTNSYLNYDCTIINSAMVTLGDNVLIAPKVGIYTIIPAPGIEQRREKLERALPVTIEDNVWIGGSAVILGGVIIGKNSIIGAGSVVTQDVPPNTIAVGNPARVLRSITDEDVKNYREEYNNQQTDGTEADKMMSGLWYNAMDYTMVKRRGDTAKKTEAFSRLTSSTIQYKDQIAKAILKSYGKNANLLTPFTCDYGDTISIGADSVVNHSAVFIDTNEISIGDHVLIGPKAGLYCASHPYDVEARNQGIEYSKPITIGDGAWLGGKVTVVPGVKIGRHSVIGAGSVVTKDIPDDVVAAGVPCKVIRKITEEDYNHPIRKNTKIR